MHDRTKSKELMPRARRSRTEWRQEVEAWRASGVSAARYASERDLHPGTLAGWGSKVGEEVKLGGSRAWSTAATATKFLPVRVSVAEPAPPVVRGDVELVLLNGRRVRLSGPFELEWVSRLIDIVEGPAPC